MPKKKPELIEVRITGPRCWFGDRLIEPGETAAVPALLAREWIQSGRALEVGAEVADDDRQNN